MPTRKPTHPALLRLRVLGVAAAALVLGNIAITQSLASALGYARALGPSWQRVYAPWAWLDWVRYYDYAPTAFNFAFIGALVLVASIVLGSVLAIGILGRSAAHVDDLHGTAHWASREEIERSGLLPRAGQRGAGVYVGAWTDPKTKAVHYLRHDGPEHVIGVAPTRSGKGVGLVVPTCLSWSESAVIADRKGELWALTAGWRSSEGGNRVVRFNPSSPTYEGFARFNPLEEIRIGEASEVGDTQNVASMLADPKGEGLNDHWSKTAFSFLTGAILHECYKAKASGGSATLASVLYAITDPARDVSQYYEEMMVARHDAANLYKLDGLHPVVAAEGRAMANKPDDERGSVLSTAVSYLALYRDPIVMHHTSTSDFRIMDLMNDASPVTLYLTSRDEDADRMKPLMRLILNQIVRILLRPEINFVDGRPVLPHAHRLLLMLDEFPAFGRLEVFQAALAFVAGYGIKAYLIAQDIAQLTAAYGRDETITANCHVRSAYAPNRIETGEWLSKMSGTTTQLKWSTTESGKRFAAIGDGYSRSAQEVSRPLITPDEAMRLKAPRKGPGGAIEEAGQMLTFVAGHAPILGTQPLYFQDPEFLRRSRLQPPGPGRNERAAAPATPVAERIGRYLWGTS